MADVEACSPPVEVDPPLLGTTVLDVVVVTPLFSVIMFAYIYLYHRGNNMSTIASLVIQLIAYLALGCLYIYNSSCRQDKFISAGYLVLVMSVFLLSSFGFEANGRTYLVEPIFWANMVAISSYCLWKFSFIIILDDYCRMKKLKSILHGAIVTILWLVIITAYGLYRIINPYRYRYVWLLIQLVAYKAVGFLYISNSSGPKEKIISTGLLVIALFVFLLCSFAKTRIRTDLIFVANIVAISLYCIWKFYPLLIPAIRAIRAWLVAFDDNPARQQEEALLRLQAQQIPFRIKDLPKEFSSDEIQAMTQDFGDRIGRGGSAQVFRGSLDDGTAIAVKRMHMHSGHTEAGEEEFRREVSIVANVHHRSLVRLLGYCLCHGHGGLYLVYPFFENGSLDRWLFHGSEEQRRLLTWPKRLCIAVDVARALAYLHKDCHRRILHLDVKPGNILLDGKLRARVSDFGISLSVTRNLSHLTSVVNTRGRGTFGYMAPEMLVNAVSDRSDVFSYGMTLLELVGGRRNFDPTSSAMPNPNIARNLREKMARGEHMELVDAAMAVDADDEEAVKTVVKVALCCIQHERDMRPSMQNVVDMLHGRVAVNLPAPETHRPSSEHTVIDMRGG